MGKPLQEFGWKQSNYERPTQGWVCGRLCEGSPCQFGPNPRGGCQVQSQCTPEKEGDRFVCRRLPAHGGPCPEGPLPDGACCQPDTRCQPRRSLMHWRRNLSMAFAAGCAAFCLFVFGGSEPTAPMSPGHVTFQHSAIETDCASCHIAADQHKSSVSVSSVTADSQDGDSFLCLNCHRDIGSEPFHPHSMSVEELHADKLGTEGTPNTDDRPLLLTLASWVDSEDHQTELACSACHQEHRGHEHDLKLLTNLQCQSCHESQFHSFSDGHPEFTVFPYSRRTRIYFDHATHLEQYFKDEDFRRLMPDGLAPESCDSCHVPDPTGDMITTRGYDQMCGSCHDREIEERDFPGVAFLALPALSAEAAKSIGAGQWPSRPVAGAVRRLPVFMSTLLQADSAYQNAADVLGDLAPGRLDEAAQKFPEEVSAYLWSIKRLIFDLTMHGDETIASRCGDQQLFNASMKPSIIPGIVAASRQWFPDLAEEVEAQQNGVTVETSLQANVAPSRSIVPESILGGGWYIGDADHTIRYRSSRHADPLVRDWIEAALSALPANGESTAVPELLAILASPTSSGYQMTGPVASGRCIMCHTIDEDGRTESMVVNWTSKKHGKQDSRLVRFSHSPHLTMPKQTECQYCHQLASTSNSAETFRADFFTRHAEHGHWQPVTSPSAARVSGFVPLSAEKCASCHIPDSAGDSCLNCHTYHHKSR